MANETRVPGQRAPTPAYSLLIALRPFDPALLVPKGSTATNPTCEDPGN
jgi:hypothetical protein